MDKESIIKSIVVPDAIASKIIALYDFWEVINDDKEQKETIHE